MPVSYDFSQRDNYLRVEVRGVARCHEEMISHARRVIDTAQRLSYSKVLIQSEGLHLELMPLDIVAFAEAMDELELWMRGLRLAVAAPSRPFESRRFIETTLVNRSIYYKVFPSEEDALGWLLR